MQLALQIANFQNIMLDFYLIKDSTSLPNHGANSIDFLEGIDHSEFEDLQNRNIIDKHLDYYKDFRWYQDQVLKKLENLKDIPSFDKAEIKLLEILSKAKETNSGIIAYCD